VFPVVIVGGGPAGCAAALTLAENGHTGIILECGYPGKEKACGDGFTIQALAMLRRWGMTPEDFQRMGGNPFFRVTLANSIDRISSDDEGSHGWVIRRAAVDQWLRDRVNSAFPVQYGTLVTGITSQLSGGYLLTLRQANQISHIECRTVILATGATNALSQAWGIDGKPEIGAAMRCYVPGGSGNDLIFLFASEYPSGYAWIFPLHDGLNIGVCSCEQAHVKQLRQHANAFGRHWDTPKHWRGGGIPSWSGQGTVWHHSTGIISCGDAAGLADPENGEGISAALLSGEQAGKTIGQYLSEHDPKVFQQYSSWVYQFGMQRYQMAPNRALLRQFSGRSAISRAG
jgi:menaquinone-9 beta-reductase